MRFTTKKVLAVTLAAAMSVSLVPGNLGGIKHSSAARQKQSTMKQDGSRKGAGEEPAATETPTVQFSKGSGTYSEVFNLELNYTADTDAAIYYTTDGSDPADVNNENRILYTADGIEVKDRKNDSNVLAAIDPILFDSVNVKVSKDRKSFESTIGAPKDEDVDKCTVIKAAAQLADGTCSPVTTNTYFIGEMADHIEGIRESVEAAGMDLSVMSISMDAEDLFDPAKGIYVKGNVFDQALEKYLEEEGDLWSTETCRDLDANYKQKGKEWERNTHIDYFESNGTETTCELQQDCGIRIQGNYSRSDYQKSFRLYARDEYGKKNFKYGFWDNAKDDDGNTIEKYKKIVLRNGGNCAFTTKFSDSYWQSLMEDIECDKQHARPCVVYLNGEYWGVYILQDDFCGAYMENKHGIDKDNILIYKGDAQAIPELGYKLDEGDFPEGVTDESYYFRELEDFMSTHDDLSKEEDFNALCEIVDKDSFLDYFATQVWINNKWDWPGKNWSVWRCTDAAIDPANPYADGKWRLMIYDVEFGGVSGSGDARENTVKNSKLLTTGTAEIGSDNFDKPHVRCFALLMTNKEFRDDFNARVESFSEGMFEQEHALAEAERYGKMYKPILGQFFKRFPTQNGSVNNAMNGGYASLKCITDFLGKRADYLPTITKWVRKQFGDPDPGATPTASPSAAPQTTTQPSASPKPTMPPTDINPPLPPSLRDQEIPLGDGSVKILHVNYIGTEVLYTAYRVEGITYRLKSDGTFSYMAKNAEKLKKKKSVVIADVVVAGGKRYKVTEIEEGALQGLKKLQKVTIGENVKTIGKDAFKNCKKLKQLVISGTKLKKVGKNAFKGTAKKLKVSCPNKKKKAYQKLIKKSGLKAKTIQIKKLSFKQSNKQAANASQKETTKARNISKLKNNAVKKAAENEAEPITMTSLKKEDGSYADAEFGAVVTIASAEELKMLSEYTRAEKRTRDVTFRQIADIDGTGMTMHGIGEVTYRLYTDDDDDSWYERGEEQFCGTYDGNGKKISNLNIAVTDGDEDVESDYYLGLFSRVYDATIKNIDLRSIRFVDEESGEVFEASSEREVLVAGIVGYAEGESLISGCSNYADITAKADHVFVSGICASSDELKIQNCHNYGNITAEGKIMGFAVGISRYVEMSASGCSNAGAINAVDAEESGAYGLFYSSYVDVLDCTNTGTVTADGEAAGIMRVCHYGQVRHCVNSGDISAKKAAGIMYSSSGDVSIFDCSNSGKISGIREAGGIVAEAVDIRAFSTSNEGEVTAEQWAGGIAALVCDSSICSTENFGKITSQNIAGGAVSVAVESELVNIWNHGEISASVSAGGIVGSANMKDVSDVFYVDLEDIGPCSIMNCIHLGTLTGEEHKGTIIAYSDKKDEIKYCYVSEESTDPVNGSDSSSVAKKVSAETWKQADFIDELNQNLSDIDTAYALAMKYDAENGIEWIPTLVLELSSDKETALIEGSLVLQIKDVAGEVYTDMRVKSDGCLAELVPGQTYEIYRLMPDGGRQLIESEISLTDGDSAYFCSPDFEIFRAYTDVKGEVQYDEEENWTYIDLKEKTLYYKQYYWEAEEVSLPPEPTKEGYDFDGWYSNPAICDESLYAEFKVNKIKEFRQEYESYIVMWDGYFDEWYGDEYDSAEDFAEARMKNFYGYATPEDFEQHYDEYYEDSYHITGLLEQEEYGTYLKAGTVYAKWTKKGITPSPVPTPGTPQVTQKPSDNTAYPVLKNLQQYKDKLGAYVQKKGVIYKVNTKKKTAAVVGVSSKMVTSVTIQSTVKTDGVNYKVTAINKKAFTGCKQLKKIRIKGKNLKKVNKKALQGAAKKIKISAPSKIKKLF